ncbi:MAG: CPBP family intramembrane metalloprotease [Polyangiaceae bacterium]|nr:CPBP family intramembrane metalloprotease [Polyangiaceae bacterium]MCW5790071.1 CPBP family intramembrane metalloprotease [Polyangiaceae bacterium]
MPRDGTLKFFTLTFLFTWGLQVPAVLLGEAWVPLAALGILGPLAAATFLTRHGEGWVGVRALFGRLLPRPGQWPSYVVAFALPAALLAAMLYAMRLAGHPGDLLLNRGPAMLAMGLALSVAEEVGWRGYALPRLRARFGAVMGSAILGVVWLVWHVPMFVGQGVPLSLMVPMLWLFIGGSLFFTWLDARTSGSLFVAVLAHLGLHFNNSHIALPADVLPLLCQSVVFAALGVAVLTFDRRAFPELRMRRPRTPSGAQPILPP